MSKTNLNSNVGLTHHESRQLSSNGIMRYTTLSNIRGGNIQLRLSHLPSCWRLLLVSMEGPASWCFCAPHERVARKCHCLSAARAGAAATSAIRSGGGCNCWIVTEEERRRWRPWFKRWIFWGREVKNTLKPLGKVTSQRYRWYLHALLLKLLAFCWWFKPLSVPTLVVFIPRKYHAFLGWYLSLRKFCACKARAKNKNTTLVVFKN